MVIILNIFQSMCPHLRLNRKRHHLHSSRCFSVESFDMSERPFRSKKILEHTEIKKLNDAQG